MNGPYETEADAYADCQHVYEAFRASNERGLMGRMNLERFNAAVAAVGVEFGAFDARITSWYAGTFEPETVQVFIGLLVRAHAAGQDALREEIADLNARIAKLEGEAASQVSPLSVDIKACGRCAVPFDPTDTAFDGRARYSKTLFCRGCVDQCHEADAFHRCIICMSGGAR